MSGRGELGGVRELRQILWGLWVAEEVPLGQIASQSQQRRPLLLGLDPFRDRGEPERLGQTDHPSYDRGVLWVGAEPRNERSVHFQRVDGEPLQVQQRGVAGAEVVHREPDAERLQRSKRTDRRFRISREDALGDLQPYL